MILVTFSYHSAVLLACLTFLIPTAAVTISQVIECEEVQMSTSCQWFCHLFQTAFLFGYLQHVWFKSAEPQNRGIRHLKGSQRSASPGPPKVPEELQLYIKEPWQLLLRLFSRKSFKKEKRKKEAAILKTDFLKLYLAFQQTPDRRCPVPNTNPLLFTNPSKPS